MKFGNLFVDGIDYVDGINFTTLLLCMVIYFVFFWLAVSIWVFVDANRRYNNWKVAAIFAAFVFFAFFPALIFYFAVRPDILGDGEDILHTMEHGGVNIPIANFVGNEGIKMTLELNIHPKPVQTELPADMKVNIDWTSNQADFRLNDQYMNVVSQDSRNSNLSFGQRMKNLRERIAKKISGYSSNNSANKLNDGSQSDEDSYFKKKIRFFKRDKRRKNRNR